MDTCDSIRYREEARASARTHTEEGNLSLTRILNGCAEARTVGTHYSTTHPPPLRQNSTLPPLLPSAFLLTLLFPPRRPRWSRAAPSPFRELFLAAVLLSLFRIPGPPVPHPSMTASSRSRHLRSLLYSFPLILSALVHPMRTLKQFLCHVRVCMYVCVMAHSTHM